MKKAYNVIFAIAFLVGSVSCVYGAIEHDVYYMSFAAYNMILGVGCLVLRKE